MTTVNAMQNSLKISIEALKEDETPERAEKTTGSAAGYAKAVREVMKVAEGNWGWCIVHVRVNCGGSVGEDWLGNCSYKNALDFVENSGYFVAMVKTAAEQTVRKAKETRGNSQ